MNPNATETRSDAYEAALELGRELSDDAGPSTSYYEVHEDQMEDGNVSLRVSLQLLVPKLMAAMAERDYALEVIGPDPEYDGRRTLFAIRTDGDVHEGVY